ncbi:hypothetical protein ACOMHN_037084 [Nucella lapillus]
MIQTFGWSRNIGYSFMDSCVKLHVPENHVAMISLVSLDLDLQRNQMDCADYLFIDNSGKCSAHDDNRNAICQMQDLRPTVMNGHRILSFRFKSDRGSFWLNLDFAYCIPSTRILKSQNSCLMANGIAVCPIMPPSRCISSARMSLSVQTEVLR